MGSKKGSYQLANSDPENGIELREKRDEAVFPFPGDPFHNLPSNDLKALFLECQKAKINFDEVKKHLDNIGKKFWGPVNLLDILSQSWNDSSQRLERGCSEMEKLEGEVSFPRENFSFPRSDSCQNRAQRGFGSPDRGKEKFSRGKEEPEIFSIEE